MLRITAFNQSVLIEANEGAVIDLLYRFLDKYYTLQKNSSGRQQANARADIDETPGSIFASRVKNTHAWYLHINQFAHFYQYCKDQGRELVFSEKIDMRSYTSPAVNYEVREGWTVREDQEDSVSFLTTNPVKSKLLGLQPGKGKMLLMDAPIKVPGGWVLNRHITIGTVVTTRDGGVARVTDVHHSASEPFAKIVFEDGRETSACMEHQWAVSFKLRDGGFTPYQTLQTGEICTELYLHSERYEYATIPMCESENVDSYIPTLPMTAYDVGVAIREVDIYSTSDYNGYKHGCTYQRLELLLGMLGDDVIPATYSTHNLFIARELVYLARSLGMAATMVEYPELKSYRGCVTVSYTRYQLKFAEQDRLRITSITSIGNREGQCISIDSEEKLYITNDFIVTHNTFTSLYAIAKLNMRMGVVILPGYIDKWIKDITTIHKTTGERIMVVRGSAGRSGSEQLAGLVDAARQGDRDFDYLIISNAIYRNFIKDYEENHEDAVERYGCAPIELMPLLGIDLLLIDESHQHLYATYLAMVHSNVKYIIGLSATLLTEDPVIERVHRCIYPEDDRSGQKELDCYAYYINANYQISNRWIKKIKTAPWGSNNYSHIELEKSIMRDKQLLALYCDIIIELIETFYIEELIARDKLGVYVSSIKFASHLTKVLQDRYPMLDVRRYCEDDPYENVIEPDIRVTTPGSAGTAIDIPDLITVVNTISISSIVANVQLVGRLRKLKDKDVRFVQMLSKHLTAHRNHHRKRNEFMSKRVKKILEVECRRGL